MSGDLSLYLEDQHVMMREMVREFAFDLHESILQPATNRSPDRGEQDQGHAMTELEQPSAPVDLPRGPEHQPASELDVQLAGDQLDVHPGPQ